MARDDTGELGVLQPEHGPAYTRWSALDDVIGATALAVAGVAILRHATRWSWDRLRSPKNLLRSLWSKWEAASTAAVEAWHKGGSTPRQAI